LSNTLLSVKNLTKKFGSVTALNNISLEIKNNEMFALLGPSGCGKTTLLRIIAGFESPDSGSVLINDTDLLSIPTRIRPVNLMFQSYALFPHMDVYSNISYGLTNMNLSKSEITNQTNEIIEKIGLTEHVKKKPNQLSGGQQQRVALARAIARKPKLLLLDEPLSALDKKIRQEMQTELKRIQHEVGITFIIVTHDQEEAMAMADRVGVMSNGKLEQIDRPNIVYSSPTSAFVASFVGAMNRLPAKLDGNKVHTLGQSISHGGGASGSDLVALIRPESIEVSVAKTSGDKTGSVLARSFLGPQTRLTIVTSETKTNIHVDLPSSDAGPFAPGALVELKIAAQTLLTDYRVKN